MNHLRPKNSEAQYVEAKHLYMAQSMRFIKQFEVGAF